MFCDPKFGDILGLFLLVVVIGVIMALCAYFLPGFDVDGYGGAGEPRSRKRTSTRLKDMSMYPASKAEQACRVELEKLTGEKFPTAYPSWLGGLELDGYCEKLRLAFEYQGPQHTRFDKKYDKRYEDYYERVLNDEKKIRLCRENGVYLIVVDYIVPRHQLNTYLRSRIYDACQEIPAMCQTGIMSTLAYRLPNYIDAVKHDPYHHEEWERDLAWIRKKTGVDARHP